MALSDEIQAYRNAYNSENAEVYEDECEACKIYHEDEKKYTGLTEEE